MYICQLTLRRFGPPQSSVLLPLHGMLQSAGAAGAPPFWIAVSQTAMEGRIEGVSDLLELSHISQQNIQHCAANSTPAMGKLFVKHACVQPSTVKLPGTLTPTERTRAATESL